MHSLQCKENKLSGEGCQFLIYVLQSITRRITDEQAAKIKAGNFTVGIAMGWLGDDWASEQLIGLKETFEEQGGKNFAVVPCLNATPEIRAAMLQVLAARLRGD